MALGETLSSMRERYVKLDDQMPVARLIQRTARALASLDDAQERERGQLAFRVALLDPGPHRRALRGVLAQGKCMEKAEPPGIGDPIQRRRGTFVLFVAGALEQRWVAREEV